MASTSSIATTLLAVVAAGWLIPAGEAFAQTPARQSSGGGLFGGASPAGTERHTLDLSASLAGAYDDNLVADATPTAASGAFQASGVYSSFIPQVNFARRGRVQLAINAGSNLRYYDHGHQFVALSHSIGAGVSAQVTPRNSFSINQSVNYAPASLFGLFAPAFAPALGDVVAPGDDTHVTSERSYVYATTAGFSHSLGGRTTLSLNSGYRYSDFVGDVPGFTDLRSYEVGGRLNHSLDRRVGLRLGYTYRKAQYSSLQNPVENALDIGIDYSRALSQTRRMVFGFTLGPTMIDGPIEGNLSAAANRQYRIVGEAFVSRDIGRSWNGRASYRRGVGFVQGISQPVFSDAVTIQGTGLLNRRTDFDASVAFSSGGSALTGASTPFTMYNANSRLRFAITKMWATYIEYLFYFYDFNQSTQLPPGVPSRLTRNGARIGLTLWVPVRHR